VLSGSGYAEDLALAILAVEAAGRAVMRHFGEELHVVEKSRDQPVTAADLEADLILRHALLGARPGYGWLSEETTDRRDRLAAERVWIVDPLDGTRSFIDGWPEFTISVGLAERGRAAVGVIHNPATAELFWAVRGGGAFARAPGGGSVTPGSLAALVPGAERGAWRGSRGASSGSREQVFPVGRRLRVSRRSTRDQAVLLASRAEIAAGEFDPFHGGWRLLATGSTA